MTLGTPARARRVLKSTTGFARRGIDSTSFRVPKAVSGLRNPRGGTGSRTERPSSIHFSEELLHKQHLTIGWKRPDFVRCQHFDLVAHLAEFGHRRDNLVAHVLGVLLGGPAAM